MPERPHACPDLSPARLDTDPLLAQIAQMVAYMDLHIGRHEVKQMTTEQKELWADLVDAAGVHAAAHDDGDHPPRRVARWWRPGHPFHDSIPTSADDPRLVDGDDGEPDPFVYADEGGDRVRGADQPAYVDDAAVQVARHALLDVHNYTHPHWMTRHDDFAAVYEWAKQSVRPMRMTTGENAGEIGRLRAYPSPRQAAKFLAEHRAARSA